MNNSMVFVCVCVPECEFATNWSFWAQSDTVSKCQQRQHATACSTACEAVLTKGQMGPAARSMAQPGTAMAGGSCDQFRRASPGSSVSNGFSCKFPWVGNAARINYHETIWSSSILFAIVLEHAVQTKQRWKETLNNAAMFCGQIMQTHCVLQIWTIYIPWTHVRICATYLAVVPSSQSTTQRKRFRKKYIVSSYLVTWAREQESNFNTPQPLDLHKGSEAPCVFSRKQERQPRTASELQTALYTSLGSQGSARVLKANFWKEFGKEP